MLALASKLLCFALLVCLALESFPFAILMLASVLARLVVALSIVVLILCHLRTAKYILQRFNILSQVYGHKERSFHTQEIIDLLLLLLLALLHGFPILVQIYDHNVPSTVQRSRGNCNQSIKYLFVTDLQTDQAVREET